MPSRRFWVIAGVLATGAGLTAVAAHAYRGHHENGWHRGDGGHHGEGRGMRHKSGRGPISKEDFDARTRSRFARFDANSDGTVDSEEVRAMVERRMKRHQRRRRAGRMGQRMMRRFDVDKDGKVTRDEFDTRTTEMFGRADLDRDGKITDADLPPMMRDRGVLSGKGAMRRKGRRRGARFMRFLRGADTNGDNVITSEEAKVEAFKRFDRFDRNSDRVVDKSDLESLKSESIDYRVRRFMHRYGGDAQGKVTLEQFSKVRDERFARRDFNNDGKLSRDEMPGRHGRKSHHRKEWRGKHGRHGPKHGERHPRRGERGADNPERRL